MQNQKPNLPVLTKKDMRRIATAMNRLRRRYSKLRRQRLASELS